MAKQRAPKASNHLYYGDNLDILGRYIGDESVDLVYLDPPFNSDANYNVLFAEQNGNRAAAQIKAFGDTWRWDQSSAASFQSVVEGGGNVATAMLAMRTFLGDNDVLAYLSMMAPRLVELRRVMKPTATIYLHCYPTASHYLKLLMDAVFGPKMFINEIAWCYDTGGRSKWCGETQGEVVHRGEVLSGCECPGCVLSGADLDMFDPRFGLVGVHLRPPTHVDGVAVIADLLDSQVAEAVFSLPQLAAVAGFAQAGGFDVSVLVEPGVQPTHVR